MTAPPPPSNGALLNIVIIEALVVLVILYRSIRTYYGRPLSLARLATFPLLVLLLYVIAEAETALTVPWSYPIWTAADAALLVAAAALTLPLASRLISVYRNADGGWMYRYGFELIAFFLALWITRLALTLYYDPAALEFTLGAAPSLSPLASDVLQLVQALFSVSAGLIIGRVVGTYRMYRTALASERPPRASLP